MIMKPYFTVRSFHKNDFVIRVASSGLQCVCFQKSKQFRFSDKIAVRSLKDAVKPGQ